MEIFCLDYSEEDQQRHIRKKVGLSTLCGLVKTDPILEISESGLIAMISQKPEVFCADCLYLIRKYFAWINFDDQSDVLSRYQKRLHARRQTWL